MADTGMVGGKNASLGELYQNLASHGVQVPFGFATSASAYWHFLENNQIKQALTDTLNKLDTTTFSNLNEVGEQCRKTILEAEFPKELKDDILTAYGELCRQTGTSSVAVRSSATAEDLPQASFAGQLESYLNIDGAEALLDACHRCYASLFTNRAIKYREDNDFDHMQVALSVGVQQMVRSDKASSGVGFTLEPDTGFQNVIVITGSWGLGENVVQGSVNPDEFVVFKPTLGKSAQPIISRKLGNKALTMIYARDPHADSPVLNIDTPEEKRNTFILNDEEVVLLANWCRAIEQHYKRHMDIEWAKDGLTGQFYIVQARPETVHATQKPEAKICSLKEKGTVLATGVALGEHIASGKARILHSPAEANLLQEGEVLVADSTNPDWDPIMKKAAAVITNRGGRTSHAAIVARELGVVAVVATGNATETIKDGQEVTVSCAEGRQGKIYDGKLNWTEQTINLQAITLPETEIMLILGDPDKAFQLSFLPNNGVGLMRLEFIINHAVKVHPMALVRFDELEDAEAKAAIAELTLGYANKEAYFVDQLSQAVATIAAAFYPKDVIVRMSDFKTNEYANLLGGQQFEFDEANPMIGFRGASRYYSPLYMEGFRLECEAMKVVREEMGLDNVKLMIPFCRTVEEGRKVVEQMEKNGLKRGENGLELYMMVEIPSNVILAKEFAKYFDGFSIGSNDLTQLTLGIDRDAEQIHYLFDERNEAVKTMIATAISSARSTGTKIGLCGQAPSDFPEFAGFLVKEGINSISFNPDALLNGIENVKKAEKEHPKYPVMSYNFNNKVALVTGASSGIGKATAEAFAREGAQVIIADVQAEAGQAAIDAITKSGGKATFIESNMAEPDSVKALFDAIESQFGQLDMAFNNAGIEGEQAFTADSSLDNWNRVININLRGIFLCMKYEIALMLKNGGGAIVNCSSVAGLVGFAGIPAYTASKHGVVGLTKTAALEYAQQGIRVNAVNPGVIHTSMIDRFTGGKEEMEEAMIAMEPVGRMGKPEEIAQAVLWLCSDKASFVTGQPLAVDGGFVAR